MFSQSRLKLNPNKSVKCTLENDNRLSIHLPYLFTEFTTELLNLFFKFYMPT